MHLKIDTLLLADDFENFRKICLKLYQVDSTKFLWTSGLAPLTLIWVGFSGVCFEVGGGKIIPLSKTC